MEYDTITVGKFISKIKEFEKLHGIDLTNAEISYYDGEYSPTESHTVLLEKFSDGEHYIVLDGSIKRSS